MQRRRILGLAPALLAVAACGATPEAPGGATGTAAPGSPEHFMQSAGDRVFFELDSWTLTPVARETLTRQAAWLKQYGERYPVVTIEGHADERGTREYNIALGERRAAAARDFLAAGGVARGKLRIVSFGKERPEIVGNDEGSWSRNRRAVTTLR
ncbi:MAG: OmpA family protein [Rhodospirillales bacterium]|nr:MAG: OmpA family protein [Rhodospirillales bacterium]